MPKEKIRLDDYLISLRLATDLKHSHSLILSESILVNDKPITKVGTFVRYSDSIRVREKIKNYVSRGAYKLLGAFEAFSKLNIENLVCIDIGASTGGFTQVLLEKKVKHVYAIDVGYGQLSHKIANNSRVTVIDRTHIKDLDWNRIREKSSPFFFTMDLSFISLTAVFPIISKFADKNPMDFFEGIALIKPQFELPAHLSDKGIIRDRKLQLKSILNVWRVIRKSDAKYRLLGLCESPIQGTEGNHEFLIWWKRNSMEAGIDGIS